jgi:hypothetical protein
MTIAPVQINPQEGYTQWQYLIVEGVLIMLKSSGIRG